LQTGQLSVEIQPL